MSSSDSDNDSFDDTNQELYLCVLTGLTFVSRVNVNQKMAVSAGEPSIQRDTLWTSVSRFIYGESRQQTLEYLKSLFRDALAVAVQFGENDKTERLKNLKRTFRRAGTGIENLCKTYREHEYFASELKCLYDDYMKRIDAIEKTA